MIHYHHHNNNHHHHHHHYHTRPFSLSPFLGTPGFVRCGGGAASSGHSACSTARPGCAPYGGTRSTTSAGCGSGPAPPPASRLSASMLTPRPQERTARAARPPLQPPPLQPPPTPPTPPTPTTGPRRRRWARSGPCPWALCMPAPRTGAPPHHTVKHAQRRRPELTQGFDLKLAGPDEAVSSPSPFCCMHCASHAE